MEPKDPDAYEPARPGLPEAVDPATGNGMAWAPDAHASALRQPDPLKILDNWIGPGAIPATPSGIAPHHEPDSPLPGERQLTDKTSGQPGKLPATPEASAPARPQVRPGKRIRKALEAAPAPVPAENDKLDIPAPAETQLQPMGLSPFVTWLKSLSGSEYVHPYEEEGLSDILDGKHQDVASETLADLLAAQGYTDRAIGMYEALMRKYPEKSAFFAAKIKALQ